MQLFRSLLKQQEKRINGEKCFFVPIYDDLKTLLENNLFKNSEKTAELSKEMIDIIKNLLQNVPNNDFNSCLFLEQSDSEYSCCVHDDAPEMCKIYPKNHGYVCLGQRERYGSKEFFEFQKTRVKSAIAVLKMLFEEKIKNPICFDILTFLMDYGTLPESVVHDFFEKEMNVKTSTFQACVKELADNSLLFLLKDTESGKPLLRSVSYEHVNQMVDEIMKQKGWTVL